MSRITEDGEGKRIILHDDGSYEEVDKGGCFIATAAYGTPFSEEINILRHWRDVSLKSNFLGRLFIKVYYTLSPPIANFIRTRKNLKYVVRSILNPYVRLLKRIYKK